MQLTSWRTAAATPQPGCAAPAQLSARRHTCVVSLPRAAVLLALLVVLSSSSTQAIIRSSGGGTGAVGRTGSTGTTGSSTVIGRSIGVQDRLRMTSAVLLASVWFYGSSYPSMRFNYNGYYDDCALRNITSNEFSGNDSAIDINVVNSLPTTMPASASASDIATFNQSLYDTTNGLIIDQTYCNYTKTGGAAGAVRWPMILSLAVALVAAFGLADFARWRL